MSDNSTQDKILDAVQNLAKRMDSLESGDARKDDNPRQSHEGIGARQPGEAVQAARLDSIPAMMRESKALRDELDAKERLLNRAMREQGPLSERDRAMMSEIQAKHDSVQAGLGKQAPAPLPGENARMYRARMLNDLRKYHPSFQNADFGKEDMALMDAVEPQLIAAARQEAKRPTLDLPEDGALRKVVRTDESGRKVTEFFGKSTFV